MKSVLSFLLVLFVCNTYAQVNFSGVYGDNSKAKFTKEEFDYYRANDKSPDDDARKGINSLVLIKKNNNEYKFWLYADRGYPSYNSGHINGNVKFNGNKAIFNRYDSVFETRCKIIFEIKGNTITVDDKYGNGCSFGANVTASGDYKRINKKLLTVNDIKSTYQYEVPDVVVTSAKAYIYTSPNESGVSKQYFIKGDTLANFDEEVAFIFTQHITKTGRYVEGWIRKADLKK
jgi:hypothetical protein